MNPAPIKIADRPIIEAYLIRQGVLNPSTFIENTLCDETGLPVSQGDIHEKMQHHITDNERGVIKFPREHGKTTQMIARIAWEIGHNPDIRIKIVSSADGIAAERGSAVRKLLESPVYHSIFPNIEKGHIWSDSKLTVKRNVISPDGTLACFGILSAATGGRADLIFLDDPDDEIVVRSPARRRTNVERVNNVWLNLLTPAGRAYLLCTPWHEQDISHSRVKAGWPELQFAIKGLQPVWPERWHTEALIKKRKDIGSLPFARGWELMVVSLEDAVIKPDWFRFWNESPKVIRLAIAVDLGISEEKGSDYTAIGVFGADKDNHIYLLQIIRERIDFPTTLKRIDAVAESACQNYNLFPTIGIEDTAYQRAVPQTMKKNSRFPIRGLTAVRNKHWRAEQAGVVIENGKFYLKGDGNGGVHPEQQIVYDECTTFPSAAHDDTVDVVGYGIEMLAMNQYKRQVAFVQGARRAA